MRRMFDSTRAVDIPPTATMVAGYIDGPYTWSRTDWFLFPHATKVRIATHATTNDGHVLDVEKGDATPVESVRWVINRRRAGAIPSVYCGASLWPLLIAVFKDAKVPQPGYWIEHWGTDAQTLPELDGIRAVAKQFRPGTNDGVRHYDESIVADFWPGVDGKSSMAITKADAALIVDEMMDRIITDASGNALGGGHLRFILAYLFEIAEKIPGLVDDVAKVKQSLLSTDEELSTALLSSFSQAMAPIVRAAFAQLAATNTAPSPDSLTQAMAVILGEHTQPALG